MKKKFVILMVFLFLFIAPTIGNMPSDVVTKEAKVEVVKTSNLEDWITSRNSWEQKSDTIVTNKCDKRKKENRRHKK